MIKQIQNHQFIILFFLIFSSISISVFAAERIQNPSHITTGFGLELLAYEERIPEKSTVSDATISNWIFAFEGLKNWRNIFVGIKGVVPVAKDDDQEKWQLSGNTVQTNSLKNSWTRIDGFIGYPLNLLLNPYLGLRWSECRQERSDFISLFGPPVEPISIETVIAKYILLGIRGDVVLHQNWAFGYGLEYLHPVSVKVENSAIPGWQVSDVDGYSIALSSQLVYLFSNKISLGFQLNSGRNH